MVRKKNLPKKQSLMSTTTEKYKLKMLREIKEILSVAITELLIVKSKMKMRLKE
jgi:hypothetical protein